MAPLSPRVPFFWRKRPEPRWDPQIVPLTLHETGEGGDAIADEEVGSGEHVEVEVRIGVPGVLPRPGLDEGHVRPLEVLVGQRLGHVVVVRGDKDRLGAVVRDGPPKLLHDDLLGGEAHRTRDLAAFPAVPDALRGGEECGRVGDVLAGALLKTKQKALSMI